MESSLSTRKGLHKDENISSINKFTVILIKKKMRVILTLFLTLLISYGYGQKLDSCGVDNKPQLNHCESTLLNEYLKNQKDNFDFTNKNVLFVSGSSGSTIISKQSYFDGIKEYNEANSRIETSLIRLNEKEKVESGGYDAIVTCWVKVFGGTKRVIKKIKENNRKYDLKH